MAASIRWICVMTLVVLLMVHDVTSENACCSFPCKHRSVCLAGKEPGTYTCDCTNLQYYGKNCETPYFFQRFKESIKPGPDTVHNLLVSDYTKWIFYFINNIQSWSHALMRKVYLVRSNILNTPALYESFHEYTTVDAHTNASVYARTLPPVPLDCPTPMGVKGPKVLPDVDMMAKKLFTRTTFRPEPMGSSLIFAYFAQHFTHMFFKSFADKNPGLTWSGHGVDVTALYGTTVSDEHLLRSFTDGKFKMQELNGEMFPMYQKDVPIKMRYPEGTKDSNKFALGHPFFSLLPGLFLYQTIWMREHNRVCDVLKQEHPQWDDERLFQTSKLIILGETIKIVIEDYVQHLANYNLRLKFEPTVLFDEPFQYRNKISVEFNNIYHWHPLMPETFNVNGTIYEMKDYLYQSDLVVKHGTNAFADSMSKQRAGQMAHNNHGASTLPVLRQTILSGRTLRFQSLNNYRERFGLRRYTSFEDLTGEKELSKVLEEMYLDVDAVELYPGVLTERRRKRALFGSTIVEVGGPFSVKGLLSNPICSKHYWKPSTFGGDVGFNIVKTATIEKLFCANIDGPCPLVSMTVPDYVEGDVDELNNFKIPKDEL